MTRPTAATSAAFEPERPETMYMLTTMTWNRPPRRWPTNACTILTSRRLMPPSFITMPARMKKGTARRT